MKVKLTANLNAGKGKGKRIRAMILKFLKVNSIEISEHEFDRHLVIGGDGTINRAINDPEGLKAPLMLFCSGVGNDLVRNLGIPKDPFTAFKAALLGREKKIDLISVNNELAHSVASFGFDAKVNRLAIWLKHKFWLLPAEVMYVIAVFWEWLSLSSYEVEIEAAGFVVWDEVMMIAVANTPSYARFFKIAPEAKMDDGLLDIVIIRKMGRIQILKNIFRIMRGTHIGSAGIKVLRAENIVIRSKWMPFQMDGEVKKSEREYQIRIHPKALKVIVE